MCPAIYSKRPKPVRVSAFFLSAAAIFSGCRFQGAAFAGRFPVTVFRAAT